MGISPWLRIITVGAALVIVLGSPGITTAQGVISDQLIITPFAGLPIIFLEEALAQLPDE